MAGVLTRPERGHARVAFLLCRPFGSEAIRASMFFRSLAARLSRDGCATLCFDYHGTGDAPGEGRHQSMQNWQQDILVADAYLRRSAGVMRSHWFGLALGATLAARAALQAAPSSRPSQLVLWEPVVDGRDYGQTMLSRHRSEMQRWFRARWHVIKRDLGEPEPTLPGTVLGFQVGDALAREFEQLQDLPAAALLDAGIGVTVGQAAGVAALAADDRLKSITIAQPVNWMTNHAPDGEEYRGAAIVPLEAIAAARETLHAAGPVYL
jgi:uncharacterized protein